MGQPDKETLISQVIAVEWDMFHDTPNAGGPALCQQDRRTFEVYRYAQAVSWTEAALQSYLNDLAEAKAAGRNLMTEKYARMMASTWPEEYAGIAPLLPPLEDGVGELIEKTVAILIEWEGALRLKYPEIARRGRPLRSAEDSHSATSFETYYRGELATFSRKTLELYYDDIMKLRSEDKNGLEAAREHLIASGLIGRQPSG